MQARGFGPAKAGPLLTAQPVIMAIIAPNFYIPQYQRTAGQRQGIASGIMATSRNVGMV